MKMRLPITQRELADKDFIPFAPYVILEDEGRVLLYSPSGWSKRIERPRLEEVTPEDARAVFFLPEQETVYLSEIRDSPSDDMFAPELLRWLRDWWIETVAELRNPPSAVPGKAERVA